MATAQYVVTGYGRDSITVKIIVGEKSDFIQLQWDGATPLEQFLKPIVNNFAWQMSKTKHAPDLASAVGKTGSVEIEDPMKMQQPPPPPGQPVMVQ